MGNSCFILYVWKMPHLPLDTAPITWCTPLFDFSSVQSLILFAPIALKLYWIATITNVPKRRQLARSQRCGTSQKSQELTKLQDALYIYIYIYIYIGFKTFFYVVRHLDSSASYLPTGLHLGFFRSWPSLYLPSSFFYLIAICALPDAQDSSDGLTSRRVTVWRHVSPGEHQP